MANNNLYRSATPGTSFYSTTTSGTEPDMRQELINTFNGEFPEIAKAQDGLLRRMSTDSNGDRISCGCVDAITREPDKDRWCPICYGEGYIWSEESLQFYRVLEDSDVDNALLNTLKEPGLINVPLVVFYIRYDSNITRYDKIVQLVLDTDGNVVTPYRREGIYRINKAWDYRSDNGKLEYWKVFTHQESVKYLNPPSYGEV